MGAVRDASTGYLKYAFRYAVNAPQAFWTVFGDGLVPDTWVHVVAVLDGEQGTLKLYAGSAPPVTTAVTTGILPGSTTLNIGRSTLQQPGFGLPPDGPGRRHRDLQPRAGPRGSRGPGRRARPRPQLTAC